MARFGIKKIKESILEKGFWEDFYEWRISTSTIFRITPIEQLDEKNKTKRLIYEVRARCDYDFRCECPTLERAVEFCDVFQNWIMDGFSKYGWPGWAEKNKLKP